MGASARLGGVMIAPKDRLLESCRIFQFVSDAIYKKPSHYCRELSEISGVALSAIMRLAGGYYESIPRHKTLCKLERAVLILREADKKRAEVISRYKKTEWEDK